MLFGLASSPTPSTRPELNSNPPPHPTPPTSHTPPHPLPPLHKLAATLRPALARKWLRCPPPAYTLMSPADLAPASSVLAPLSMYASCMLPCPYAPTFLSASLRLPGPWLILNMVSRFSLLSSSMPHAHSFQQAALTIRFPSINRTDAELRLLDAHEPIHAQLQSRFLQIWLAGVRLQGCICRCKETGGRGAHTAQAAAVQTWRAINPCTRESFHQYAQLALCKVLLAPLPSRVARSSTCRNNGRRYRRNGRPDHGAAFPCQHEFEADDGGPQEKRNATHSAESKQPGQRLQVCPLACCKTVGVRKRIAGDSDLKPSKLVASRCL